MHNKKPCCGSDGGVGGGGGGADGDDRILVKTFASIVVLHMTIRYSRECDERWRRKGTERKKK